MLPALIGFAAKALLPSDNKKVNKDKLLENKPVKEGKKDSADVDETSSSITIRKKSISTSLLLPSVNIEEPPKKEEIGKKGGGLKKIFGKIGETLNGIIKSIGGRNNARQRQLANDKKETQIENTKNKEKNLEKRKTKNSTPSLRLPGDRFGIGNFFKNIILGSIALAIFKNIEKIISFLREVYNRIKEFIEELGRFIKPIWDALKWVVVGGVKLANDIRSFLGIGNRTEDEEYAKKIENTFGDIENIIKGSFGIFGIGPGGEGGENGQPFTGEEVPLGQGEVASANAVYSGLVQRGFSKEEAAAITGNIRAESTFNTGAVNPKSGAFGLMQWLGSRKTNLIQFAGDRGKSATDLGVQLDFIKWELSGGDPYETSQFRKAMAYGSDVESKTRGFAYEVERASSEEIQGSMGKRLGAAKSVYGSTVSSSPKSEPPSLLNVAPSSTSSESATRRSQTSSRRSTSPSTSGASANAESAARQTIPSVATANAQPPQPQIQPQMQSQAVAAIPGISQFAEYEMPAGSLNSGLMIAPVPMGGSPMISGGGGTRYIPVGPSLKDLLNSYYQAQLTGSLYKRG